MISLKLFAEISMCSVIVSLYNWFYNFCIENRNRDTVIFLVNVKGNFKKALLQTWTYVPSLVYCVFKTIFNFIVYPNSKCHSLICYSGVILGAKVTEYLLEKSRIVTQAPEERNYHVFYELLAGLSEETKLKYGLLAADKYFYLNQVCSFVYLIN